MDEVAYYYTSVQTVIPLASIAELTWTGIYNRLLKRPGDPAAEEFLLGYDSEPIRAEKSLAALAAWVRTGTEWTAVTPGSFARPAADLVLIRTRMPL